MSYHTTANNVSRFDSYQFNWFGQKATASFSDLGVQQNQLRQFDIVSGRTGKVVRFYHDDAAYEQHEGWDGMQRRYKSDDGKVEINIFSE